MHRGVRVDGATVQSLRISKCWSQRQLAEAAGISERTVRNAEKSLVLETYIANYLATALEVTLNEIVMERAEVRRGSRLNTLIRRVSSAYMKAVIDGTNHHLVQLLHPNIEWNCSAAPDQLFSGLFVGIERVQAHLQLAAAWWEQFGARGSDFSLQRTDAEGEMIYFHLCGKVKAETGDAFEIWQTFICRFDDELLVSVDQSIGMVEHRRPKPARNQ